MLLQYTVMKTLAMLLLFGFLSACSTLTDNLVYSNSIPTVWIIEGRLSATVKGETKTANFELIHQAKYHQLTLSNSLGFGQIKVKETQQGLSVDGRLISLSLQGWMLTKLGWPFPMKKLEQLVFKHDLSDSGGWQVKVGKYQTINDIAYPKIIHFKNQRSSIKIKLLLREINRLK